MPEADPCQEAERLDVAMVSFETVEAAHPRVISLDGPWRPGFLLALDHGNVLSEND